MVAKTQVQILVTAVFTFLISLLIQLATIMKQYSYEYTGKKFNSVMDVRPCMYTLLSRVHNKAVL